MRVLPGLGCVILVLGLMTGCKSTAPAAAEGALAWTEIKGHSEIEVTRTLMDTFKQAGYEFVRVPQAQDEIKLQFEKLGGTGANLLYSDWSFKQIWYRVRITITETSPNTSLVKCNAYRVNEKGDRVLPGGVEVHRFGIAAGAAFDFSTFFAPFQQVDGKLALLSVFTPALLLMVFALLPRRFWKPAPAVFWRRFGS